MDKDEEARQRAEVISFHLALCGIMYSVLVSTLTIFLGEE